MSEAAKPSPLTSPAKAFAAHSATAPLSGHTIVRRSPRPQDVQIEILFCGVYPCVPGHEIVGRVTKVGRDVKKFREGDIAAVGCLVESCGICSNCKAGEEQYCENGWTLTYNSEDKILGGVTYGGYSESIVVDERYVLRVPKGLDPAGTAPLLCAGITSYSPLHHWKVGKGQKVGIVGLGGLGHMGIKFAKALGAHVALFTTSPNKADDAVRLGADEVIVSKDKAAMQ